MGYVRGFFGGVAADEPKAALVGRDILSAGGTAADAAVAIYFTMAVTLPSSASLGGGGICVVRDSKSKEVQTLDFLSRVPSAIPPSATRPSAIPGNARGFFALHAKYGRLQWAELIRDAENSARFGVPISRALASDMKRMEGVLLKEPSLRKIFGRPDGGGLLGEGDLLVQLELSGILARIRSRGATDIYTGPIARDLAAAANAVGGSLSYEDLRAYRPLWRNTIEVPYQASLMFHFTTPPGWSGLDAAKMTAMLGYDNLYEETGSDEKDHLIAEVFGRALRDGPGRGLAQSGGQINPATHVSEDYIERLLASYDPQKHVKMTANSNAPMASPDDTSGASFTVIDREGSVVACALSMNNLFGTGRVTSDSGIVLSALPGRGGRGPNGLSAMLLASKKGFASYYASAASGGIVSPASMVSVAARAVMGTPDDLETAVGRKRVYYQLDQDITYYEAGLDPSVLSALTQRGHKTRETPVLGYVNAVLCAEGIPSPVMLCSVKTDRRGYGLSATAD